MELEDFKLDRVDNVETISAISDSYFFYMRNSENPVDVKLYKKIASGFNKFLVERILEGNEVRLPSKLGIIAIVGRKLKPRIGRDGAVIGLCTNWAETKKLQERDEEAKKNLTRVYHFNEHSNGIGYKLVWQSKNVICTNKIFYSFTHTKGPLGVSRKIARKVIDEGKEYQVALTD